MAEWLCRRAGAVALMVSAGVLMTPAAYAQDEQKKPDKDTQRKVLGMVKQGNELFEQGKFEEAYTLYKDAYALYPNAAILYRLAQCAENKGALREAARHYERFVKQQPESEQGVKVAQETLPAIYARVKPLVRLTSEPAGANIYVGTLAGEPIGSTPFETDALPPGKTRIIFKLDGYQTSQQEVEILPADEREVIAKLELMPTQGEEERPSGPSNTVAILGWTATGLGVAALVSGGVLTGLSMGATDDVNSYDKRGGGASRAELQGLKDDANGYYSASLGLYIAGGLLAATGIGLLVYDGMKEEAPEQPAATVRVNAGWLGQQAWIGLEGRF